MDESTSGLLDPRDPAAHRRIDAWLALQRLAAYRPETVAPALRAGRPPEALLSGPAPSPQRLERDRDVLARLGARLLPLPAPAYPERVRRLDDAPPLLVVRGDAALLDRPAVAVVGARASTAYGRRIARDVAEALAAAGVVVVSGLARGIDAVAHEACVEAGGATVALFGCGIDVLYPRGHRALAERIAERGAWVAELPVGTPPRGAHFPLRNRLISALARAVVVVEARPRSGSLVTARHAADQGVDVLAVPGPIDAATSAGTNRLLRDGAGVVLEPADVLEPLGLRPPAARRRPEDRGDAPLALFPPPPLPGIAGRVLEALADGPRTRDALARGLGVAPGELARALLELELAGRVAADRDGRLRLG